jgi:SPP1 gp7 family putative phage head morphogenesis protein
VVNEEYWLRRAENILIDNEKIALEYEKKLKEIYEVGLLYIQKEIDSFYNSYAVDGKIKLADAYKILKPEERKSYKKVQNLYISEISNYDKSFTKQYKKMVTEQSKRYNIKRLTELKTNIQHQIELIAVKNKEGLNYTLKKVYNKTYKENSDIIKEVAKEVTIIKKEVKQKTYKKVANESIPKILDIKLKVSFDKPSTKHIEALANERFNGDNYSDRIWKDKQKLINKLETTLAQEFVRGKGSKVLADIFSKELNTSFYNAQRLIRTEINAISNQATLDSYQEAGVEQYKYVATLDKRTSKICRSLDGKVFNRKEAKRGVNLPPMHPYCRSTTIAYFEDDDINKLLIDRMARNDKTGKSERLGEYKTYEQWNK